MAPLDLSQRTFRPYRPPPCPSCHRLGRGQIRRRIKPDMFPPPKLLGGATKFPPPKSALRMGWQSGLGPHFDAFQETGSGQFMKVILSWESQNFYANATQWEKIHSPLAKTNAAGPIGIGKPFDVIVDARGSVVAYYATRVKPYNIEIGSDEELKYEGWNNTTHSRRTRLSGGDLADALVDIEGRVLSVSVYDRALEPPDFLPGLLLSLAGGVGSLFVRMTRNGLRTLAVKGAARISGTRLGGVLGRLPKLVLRKNGKFATGSQTMKVYKGVGEDGVKVLRKRPEAFKMISDAEEDFTKGLYVSRHADLGGSFASKKGVILEAKVSVRDLGKVVDVRPGGMHRALYEKYMHKAVAGLSPAQVLDRGASAAYRRKYFEAFLKKHGLDDAETIIGSIGGKWTSGPLVPKGFIGEQIVIRSPAIANQVGKRLLQSFGRSATATLSAGAAAGGTMAASPPGSTDR